MKKNKTPYDLICKMKDPLEIFDLVCSANYFAGNFNQNVPVEESRRCFDRIVKLIKESHVKPC